MGPHPIVVYLYIDVCMYICIYVVDKLFTVFYWIFRGNSIF